MPRKKSKKPLDPFIKKPIELWTKGELLKKFGKAKALKLIQDHAEKVYDSRDIPPHEQN